MIIMSKLRSIFVTLAILLGVAVVISPAPAHALFSGAKNQACGGVNLSSAPTTCTDTSSSLNKIIGTAVNILSILVGIIAVIMIIIGGLKFITSSGDASNIASARNTILYAVVGLVVAAMAQILVRYVLFRLTK
jgi:hypothetical protein